MAKVTVLGIGNVLMRDEGVGVHLLERVRAARRWGQDVEFIDGGTGGLRLLTVLESARRLVVFDAADLSLPPGQYRLVASQQLAESPQGRISLHDLSFTETLRLCQQFGSAPGQVVILAIQPGDISYGRNLSPALEAECARLLGAAVELVEAQLAMPD